VRKALLIGLVAILPGALWTASAGAFQLKVFHTPGGNIGCELFFGKEAFGGEARCDIAEHDWKTPKRPRWCRLDYGNGLTVGPHRKAGFVCAGDTALHQGRKLAAGRSVSVGPYECRNLGAAVRCVNHRTGHGFRLSRKVAERF
jgi:Family of unknown function (DUF6636)